MRYDIYAATKNNCDKSRRDDAALDFRRELCGEEVKPVGPATFLGDFAVTLFAQRGEIAVLPLANLQRKSALSALISVFPQTFPIALLLRKVCGKTRIRALSA